MSSLVGPIEFPEVPGIAIQIVLALTKCATFTEEKETAPRQQLQGQNKGRNGVWVEQGYFNMD